MKKSPRDCPEALRECAPDNEYYCRSEPVRFVGAAGIGPPPDEAE